MTLFIFIENAYFFQHFHCERKNTTFVHAFRLYLQSSTVVLNEGLWDHETKAYPVWVHFGGSKELTKLLTKARHLFFGDSFPVVYNMDYQLLLGFVVSCQDPHVALTSEFERILDQIY